MRKFILTLILLIMVTAGSVAYVFYSQNQISALQSANAKLATDKANVTKERDAALAAAPTKIQTLAFTDSGQGIKLTYPASWIPDLQTIVTDIKNGTEVVGQLLDQYDYSLTKADSVLTFHRIYNAIHDGPNILNPGSQEYETISRGVIRVRNFTDDEWHYGELVDCATGVDSSAVCYTGLLPGFGTKYVTVATFHAGTNDVLSEADAIVISSLN